jgi:hypothetical protein
MSSPQRVKIFAAAALAATTAVAAQQPSAGQIPCYADMAQDYEWETQFGKGVSPMASCPGAPAWTQQWYEKGGGRIQIRLRGQEIAATREEWGWGPQLDPTSGCTGVKKITSKMTRVVKNGVQYDLNVATDKPPERSTQKVVDIRPALSVPAGGGVTLTPSTARSNKYYDVVGTQTIAGHVCTKTSSREPPGLPHTTACELEVAPQCVLFDLVQPLEVILTMPDGTESIHGRTTLLQFGALGQVVPEDAITPP